MCDTLSAICCYPLSNNKQYDCKLHGCSLSIFVCFAQSVCCRIQDWHTLLSRSSFCRVLFCFKPLTSCLMPCNSNKCQEVMQYARCMVADLGDLQHVFHDGKTYSIAKCIVPYTQRHQRSIGCQHGAQQASCLWCHTVAACVQLFQNGV